MGFEFYKVHFGHPLLNGLVERCESEFGEMIRFGLSSAVNWFHCNHCCVITEIFCNLALPLFPICKMVIRVALLQSCYKG